MILAKPPPPPHIPLYSFKNIKCCNNYSCNIKVHLQIHEPTKDYNNDSFHGSYFFPGVIRVASCTPMHFTFILPFNNLMYRSQLLAFYWQEYLLVPSWWSVWLSLTAGEEVSLYVGPSYWISAVWAYFYVPSKRVETCHWCVYMGGNTLTSIHNIIITWITELLHHKQEKSQFRVMSGNINMILAFLVTRKHLSLPFLYNSLLVKFPMCIDFKKDYQK